MNESGGHVTFAELANGIATGSFELQHVGPEVGKQLGAIASRYVMPELQYRDTLQRPETDW